MRLFICLIYYIFVCFSLCVWFLLLFFPTRKVDTENDSGHAVSCRFWTYYSDNITAEEAYDRLRGTGPQTWGYVEVRPGAHSFYWLHFSVHPDGYLNRPLILWLQVPYMDWLIHWFNGWGIYLTNNLKCHTVKYIIWDNNENTTGTY